MARQGKQVEQLNLPVMFGDLRDVFAAFSAVASAPTTSAKVDAVLKFAQVFARVTPFEFDDKFVAFAAAWNENPNIHQFVVGLVDAILSRPTGSEAVLTPDHLAFFDANRQAFRIDPEAVLSVAQIIATVIRMFGLFR